MDVDGIWAVAILGEYFEYMHSTPQVPPQLCPKERQLYHE